MSKILWPNNETYYNQEYSVQCSHRQIHQIIGNIIHTFDVSKIVNNDFWSGILAATMFAVRANYHRTLQSSPMHLAFGRDIILNCKHVVYWEHIWQRKQERNNRNKRRKNMHHNNHQYKIGDKILVKRKNNYKHEL